MIEPTPLASGNTKLRLVRRLTRHRRDRHSERRYVIEGVGLVADALVAGVPIDFVVVAANASLHQLADVSVPIYSVEQSVFDGLGSTRSPQGVLAVAVMPDPVDPAALATMSFVLALVDLADPGNVGTLLRAAEAAGVEGVIVTAATADLFNSKTVRASAGSVFRLALVPADNGEQVLAMLAAADLTAVATVVEGGRPYDQVDFRDRVAVLLGNEAHGLALPDGAVSKGSVSEDATRPSMLPVTIPMAPGPESINVAMAGTVLAFEIARQRRP